MAQWSDRLYINNELWLLDQNRMMRNFSLQKKFHLREETHRLLLAEYFTQTSYFFFHRNMNFENHGKLSQMEEGSLMQWEPAIICNILP